VEHCYLNLQGFYHEEIGTGLLRNVGASLTDYMVSHTRVFDPEYGGARFRAKVDTFKKTTEFHIPVPSILKVQAAGLTERFSHVYWNKWRHSPWYYILKMERDDSTETLVSLNQKYTATYRSRQYP
jgi:hypothetical protein